jgi:transposase
VPWCKNSAFTSVSEEPGRLLWPTNNLSERGVRSLKTRPKISGRLAGDNVTQDRLDIRGYIDTARKHGLGAHGTLLQLMTGDIWLPPPQPVSP